MDDRCELCGAVPAEGEGLTECEICGTRFCPECGDIYSELCWDCYESGGEDDD